MIVSAGLKVVTVEKESRGSVMKAIAGFRPPPGTRSPLKRVAE
jgi:hypothetical protein